MSIHRQYIAIVGEVNNLTCLLTDPKVLIDGVCRTIRARCLREKRAAFTVDHIFQFLGIFLAILRRSTIFHVGSDARLKSHQIFLRKTARAHPDSGNFPY